MPQPVPASGPVFHLPSRLAAKAAPRLVAADEAHFSAVAAAVEHQRASLTDQLAQARAVGDRRGPGALARDQEVRRLTSRLRTLDRFSLEVCLGRTVGTDGSRTYVGRLGLTDASGERLLVDWRSPAAEPFFAATHQTPQGLSSRRRYRWNQGVVTDYWDEVLDPASAGDDVSLDDDSAFLASLNTSRTDRMRDVLTTIQADQDAAVRAPSRGTHVVDGGPGTGKTVVALHRAAYLLYADPRLSGHRGGVLFVGPHEPYLAYVGDVLPRLGEDGVLTCTLAGLVPEGAEVLLEPDPAVAALKSTVAMVGAVERGVAVYEEPPTEGMEVSTPWTDVWMGADDWADAFAAADPGTPHNEARDDVWEEIVAILSDKVFAEVDDPDVAADDVRAALRRCTDLTGALTRAWPLLDAADLVGDLWDVPAFLRHCAPWLSPEEVRLLRRSEPQAWTVEDLPLLDAARLRLGDPEASRERRRREAELTAEREEMAHVVDDLVASDDTEMLVMSMLRGEDLRGALDNASGLASAAPDALAGPFAHVVVDEAQELTDAQWQMLLARCPSRSFTVVGDRAQARHGFTEPWEERLARVGLTHVEVSSLTVNYRTPSELMEAAAPGILAALPDANVPTSIRSSGRPVVHGAVRDLGAVLAGWLADHDEGTACVVTTDGTGSHPDERVRHLSPVLAKGLEFDLVVLVEPDSYGEGLTGAVDRYVAMTRATDQLVVLEG